MTKIKIRKSVFETNSSSIHSLQFSKISEIPNIIKEITNSSSIEDFKDYFEDDIFYVGRWIILRNDEEYYNYYSIITSPVAKLSYIIQLSRYMFDKKVDYEKTSLWRKLKMLSISKLHEIGFKTVSDIKFRISGESEMTEFETYLNEYDSVSINDPRLINENKIEEVFNEIMSNDFMFLDSDLDYPLSTHSLIKII